MHSSYTPSLVITSIVIASLASYTALDLAGRVSAARRMARSAWLTGGAAAMGLGIWSMHFVGMLAFHMDMPMQYDLALVLLSVFVAIAASGLALYVASRREFRWGGIAAAGGVMGIAIAGMHYIGMAAMRMAAMVSYNHTRVVESIAIAIGASTVALWLSFLFREDQGWFGVMRKGGAAIVMGFAISGMHYVGMSAATFSPAVVVSPHAPWLGLMNNGPEVTIAVILCTVSILVLALASSAFDRHKKFVAQQHQLLREIHEQTEQQVQTRTAELRAALAAAELANRAKSEFLATMSHELRTPLNSVIGFANILQKNKAGNLRAQDLGYIDRIGANGKHLLGLINDILDLAKIESGRMETELSDVRLDQLVQAVVAQLEGVLRDRPVTLVADVPRHLQAIRSDEGKLRQILTNLVGNAAKFTERGTITVRVVTEPEIGAPRYIDVIDTGIGIPAERLEAVFKPFEQVDMTTARKYGGTGLGLAITKSLCELLHADLTVTSTMNVGSTFRIHLPVSATVTTTPDAEVTRSAMAVNPLPIDASPLIKKERVVLIIDDDFDSRVVLRQYTEDAGYHVVDVASGAEGIDVARDIVPDLIVLDLMMPRVNGWDVLRALKNDMRTRHIPVLVVSIVASENRGRVFGAAELIDKPCTRETLTDALQRHTTSPNARILIVEDNQDLQSVLLNQLEETQHFDVRTASNGVTALQVLGGFTPDLILLDLMMPGMDGKTLLAHLRADPRYAQIAVVVLTAQELTTVEHEQLSRQTLAILHKGPTIHEQLEQLFEKVGLKRAKPREAKASVA